MRSPLPIAALPSLALLVALAVSHAVAAPLPAAPGPGVDAPDRPWDLLVLRLDLALHPEQRSVDGTATYEVRLRAAPPGREVVDLVLDAVALDVRAVAVDGAAAEWHAGEDQIHVPLAAGAGPGTPHTIAITYAATPQTGLHFRGPGRDSPDLYPEVWSQGEGTDNRHWFPGYDHPNERFLYEGHITAPPGWKVLTNTGMEVVNYLVMVAAAPYDVHGEPANQVWVPPGTPKHALKPVWEPVAGIQARLAERTGVPYPWGPYRQVIVQRFLYGGMENTSATVESSRLLVGPEEQAVRTDPESVVAHELAHQWYGDLLTCADWHHLWLNEGFATYFAADWMATREGPDVAAAWAASVRGWYRASAGRASLTGAWFLGADTPPNAKVYVKGAAVLEMLRHQLGDATFWAGIRRYTTEHAHGLVETDDLRHAMEAVSGQELGWFFRQWTELPSAPVIDASWTWSEAAGLEVQLTQRVDDAHPAAHLPVRLLAAGPDGATHAVTVPFGEERRTVQVPLPWRPTFVALDPDGALLLEGGMKQPTAAWAAQLAGGPPYARLVAAEALGDTGGSDVVVARAALAQLLADAQAPVSLREAVAAALGASRHAPPLLAVLDDRTTSPRVRLAAAQALRSAARPEDGEHLAALRAAEASGSIRAALHEAQAATSPERAVAAARLVLRSTAANLGSDDGTLDVEYRAASAVLGERGAPGDLPLLLAAPVSRDRRTAGLAAATRIVSRMALGPDRETARSKVARAAEAALADLDQRGREAAVGVLREVGDDRSVDALDRYRAATEVKGTEESVRDAIAAIRARRDTVTPPAPNEVDARLQALEDRLKALERRDEKWMAP